MNTLEKQVHQIGTTGIIQEITMCTRAAGIEYHIVLVDKVSVRISVQEDAARLIETVVKGDVIVASRLQTNRRRDGTTELRTSKYTTFEVLFGTDAEIIKARNPDPAGAYNLSYDYNNDNEYNEIVNRNFSNDMRGTFVRGETYMHEHFDMMHLNDWVRIRQTVRRKRKCAANIQTWHKTLKV